MQNTLTIVTDRWETQGSGVTILNLAFYRWAEWFERDNVAPRLKSPQGFQWRRSESQSQQQLRWPKASSFLPLDLKLSPWTLGLMPQNCLPGMRHAKLSPAICSWADRALPKGANWGGEWGIGCGPYLVHILPSVCTLVAGWSIWSERVLCPSPLHNSIPMG